MQFIAKITRKVFKCSIRILIVDDDSIGEIIKVMLKDYDIIEAANGYEAIEATKEILKIDPKAIIIGLTAFARSRGKDMLEAGAREVVEKPFTRRKLKEIIEKHLPAAAATM